MRNLQSDTSFFFFNKKPTVKYIKCTHNANWLYWGQRGLSSDPHDTPQKKLQIAKYHAKDLVFILVVSLAFNG